MANDQREMTLKEVAYQYGDSHSAAKSYWLIYNKAWALKHCRWWEFLKKRRLTKELYDELIWIENVR